MFEKVPGSVIYSIRFADANGTIRREVSGPSVSRAVSLYQKRKPEVLQGKKLPETLWVRRVKFAELAKDCRAYSKVHKKSYGHNRCRMAFLEEQFGDRDASAITHLELNEFLQDHSDEQE